MFVIYIVYLCVCVCYPSLQHHFPEMSNTKLEWKQLNFSWSRDQGHRLFCPGKRDRKIVGGIQPVVLISSDDITRSDALWLACSHSPAPLGFVFMFVISVVIFGCGCCLLSLVGWVFNDVADVSTNQITWCLPDWQVDCGIEEEDPVISSPHHAPEWMSPQAHRYITDTRTEGLVVNVRTHNSYSTPPPTIIQGFINLLVHKTHVVSRCRHPKSGNWAQASPAANEYHLGDHQDLDQTLHRH